jgi:phosphoglycerate dehydrogenase-like enzyme
MSKHEIDTILLVYDGVLNEYTCSKEALERIKAAAPGSRLEVLKSVDEWPGRRDDLAPRVQVVFGLRPARWFQDMPHLKWAQQTGAGANWLLDMPEVAASDLILTNASGVHAIPIAEHILALMFALARVLHLNVRSQVEHQWVRRGRVQELDGATLGLVGVGAIGEKTAEKAKGLNMKVLGLRRNPERGSPFVDRMYGPDGLNDLLSQSNWVAITTALTAETKGMIGRAEFAVMKETAFIINIARGPIIQEQALIRALEEGRIAGAGLDVFEEEPLPENSLLWDMKNVIITPHFAGASPRYMDRLLDIFTENLRRFKAGLPLVNVVDKTLGY